MRILIAEDDAALAGFVKKGLEAEHHAIDISADGEQARAMAAEFDYDLIILDLNLPRLDGIAILRFLRTRKPSLPILVLTARHRVEDRVQCLDLGADDYLVKPFSFSELSARIRALLRRCHLPAESVLAVGDLKLDRVERRVERSGKRIELTSKEFALLEYLMRNAGRRITRAMIIEHVWNLSFDTSTNVVDVYINYAVLHAVGDALECRAEPCLVTRSVMNEALERFAGHREPWDLLFENWRDPIEIARIACGYVFKLGAESVRATGCGKFIWLRLSPSTPTTA